MTKRTSIDPHWRTIHEDGSDFPGSHHPSMEALRTGKEIRNVVMGVFHPDQKIHRWIQVNAIPLFQDKQTQPCQVYTTFTDITDLRDSQQALQENERRLTSLIDRLPGYVYRGLNDKSLSVDYISSYVEKITGRSQEEYLLLAKASRGHEIHPDDTARVRSEIQASLDTRQPYECTYRLINKHNNIRWVSEHGEGLFTDAGELLNLEGFVMDITDRVEAEQGLKASEERLRNVLAVTGEGVWDWDITNEIVRHNSRWCELLGFDQEKLEQPAADFLNLVHPDDRTEVIARIVACLKGEGRYYSEHRICQLDGRIVWVLDRGDVIDRDAQGKALRMVGSFTDITKRKLVEEKLHQTVTALSVAHDGVFMFYADTLKLFYVNKGAIQQTGYTEAELLNLTSLAIQSDYTESEYRTMLSPLLDDHNKVHTFETTQRNKVGKLTPVEVVLQCAILNTQYSIIGNKLWSPSCAILMKRKKRKI